MCCRTRLSQPIKICLSPAPANHHHLGSHGSRTHRHSSHGSSLTSRIHPARSRPPQYLYGYFLGSPEATKALAALMQRHPDRFLFGSDAAAPSDQSKYLKVFNQYAPLWNSLDAEASAKVRLHNYERLFDAARRRVRAWESAHVTN